MFKRELKSLQVLEDFLHIEIWEKWGGMDFEKSKIGKNKNPVIWADGSHFYFCMGKTFNHCHIHVIMLRQSGWVYGGCHLFYCFLCIELHYFDHVIRGFPDDFKDEEKDSVIVRNFLKNKIFLT